MRTLVSHILSNLWHFEARTESPTKLNAQNQQEQQQSNQQEEKNVPPVRIASSSNESEGNSVVLLSEVFSVQSKLELLGVSVNLIWLMLV